MTSWIKNYKEIDTDQHSRDSIKSIINPADWDFLERHPGQYISLDFDHIHNQDNKDLSGILGFIPMPDLLEPIQGTPSTGTPSTETPSQTPNQTPSQTLIQTLIQTPSQSTSTGTIEYRPGTAPYNLTGGVQLIQFQRYRINRPSTR